MSPARPVDDADDFFGTDDYFGREHFFSDQPATTDEKDKKMSQAPTWSVPLVGPATPTLLTQRTDDSLDALLSSHSGSTRPSYAVAGTVWLNTAIAGQHRYYFFDGVNDHLVLTVDTSTGALKIGSFGNVVGLAADLDMGGFSVLSVSSLNGGPLGGLRNKLINADGRVNQRGYVSGAATSGANQYTLDRWRVVTSGQNLAFAASGNVFTLTAPAGGIEQVIEGANIEGGTYVLNWAGTATASVNGTARTKGEAFTLPANTNATVKFAGGTVTQPQLELGNVTLFEQRPLGVETSLCMQFYEKQVQRIQNVSVGASSGGWAFRFTYATLKRVSPTTAIAGSVASGSMTGTATQSNSDTSGTDYIASFSATNANGSATFTHTADAEL